MSIGRHLSSICKLLRWKILPDPHYESFQWQPHMLADQHDLILVLILGIRGGGGIIPHSTQDSFFVGSVTHLLPLPSFYFPPFHGCQSHENSGINVLQANLCLRICFLAPGNPTFQSGEELFIYFFPHFHCRALSYFLLSVGTILSSS